MNNFKLSSIFLFVVFLFPSVPHAEPLWNQYLTSEYINDISLNGNYIWCATRNGAIRFNRVTGDTVRYTADDGLLDSFILSVAVDQNGVKWFGSSYGLSRFDGDKWMTYPAEEIGVDEFSHAAYSVDVVFIDANNNLIIHSNIGVYLFDGETFSEILKVDMRSQNITADYDGNIWLLTNGKMIVRIAIDDYSIISYDIPVQEYPFFDHFSNGFLFDSSHTMWIGGGEGVIYIQMENGPDEWDRWNQYYNTEEYYPANVSSLTEDLFGNVWICGSSGLLKYSHNAWALFKRNGPGFENKIITDEFGRIWGATTKGLFSMTPDNVVSVSETPPAPLILDPPHPNPFNPQTTISFTLPEEGFARLAVYDISGQLVRELTAESLPAGRHEIVWDGRDSTGATVSSGVYIARLTAGEHVAVRKVTLVR